MCCLMGLGPPSQIFDLGLLKFAIHIRKRSVYEYVLHNVSCKYVYTIHEN